MKNNPPSPPPRSPCDHSKKKPEELENGEITEFEKDGIIWTVVREDGELKWYGPPHVVKRRNNQKKIKNAYNGDTFKEWVGVFHSKSRDRIEVNLFSTLDELNHYEKENMHDIKHIGKYKRYYPN